MEKTIYNEAYRAQIIRALKERRRILGLKQNEVSRQAGMGATWLGKIERCELRLDVFYLVKLCRIYGVSPGKLVAGMEKELP